MKTFKTKAIAVLCALLVVLSLSISSIAQVVNIDNGTTEKDIPGITQGRGNTFASDIPLSTIWIDESKMSDASSRTFIPGEVMSSHSGFFLNTSGRTASGYSSPGAIEFDFSQEPLHNAAPSGDVPATHDVFTGVLGTFKWNSAATITDASGNIEYLDVYMEYSDLELTCYTDDESFLVDGEINSGVIGLFSGSAVQLGNSSEIVYGVAVTATPYVKDKQGNLVQGTFFKPMVDIDVRRTKNAMLYNAAARQFYSEQIMLKDGITSDIFIPGGPGDAMYLCNIDYDQTTGEYLFSPSTSGINDGDTFRSGFITQAQNGDFSLRYYGSSGKGTVQMQSFLFAGTDGNFRAKHSTEPGGTIQTTINGNTSGELDDGSTILDPTTVATARGQSVTYTFKPNPGYRLKKVSVNQNSIDYTAGGHATDDYDVFDDDNDGNPDRYTYTFSGINADKAIHVEWEALQLTVSKKTEGNEDVPDVFTFEIKASNGTNNVDFSQLQDKTFTHKGNGLYEFTLTNDESYAFPVGFIPPEYVWEITETIKGTKSGWFSVGEDHMSETIGYDQHAVFVNRRGSYELVVKKVWDDAAHPEARPDSLTVHIVKSDSTLKDGPELNSAMTSLAGGITNITAFKKASQALYNAAAAGGAVMETVSAAGETPVKMWFDSGTIYYYSEADNIFLSENASQMFDKMENLADISGCEGLNAAFATNMFAMFRDCFPLTDLSPLKNWRVDNVQSMRFMFASSTLPSKKMQYSDISALSGWNTQSVTDMGSMFRGGSITDVSPIKDWNTANVRNTNGMFFRTKISDATILDGWDMSRVGGAYINASNGQSATGNFNQMFQNLNDTTTSLSVLPIWSSRTGTWTANSAAYNTSISPVSGSADVELNQRIADNSYTLTQHEAQDNKVWIFEKEVASDVYSWRVYEDVPTHYTVSDGTTDGKGSSLSPIGGLTTTDSVTLYNKLKTRTVTLHKNWVDYGNEYDSRPSHLEGFITYDGTTKYTSHWTKQGNVWAAQFTILEDANVTDWGETDIPDEYDFAKNAHTQGTDIYEMTNTLQPPQLTVRKNTINLDGTFTFHVTVFKDENHNRIYADLSGYEGLTPAEDEDHDGVSDNGEYLFTITTNGKEGQKVLANLPHGYHYQVIEDVPDGWLLKSVKDTSGLLKGKKTAVFNNHIYIVPSTGLAVNINIVCAVIVILICLGLLTRKLAKRKGYSLRSK